MLSPRMYARRGSGLCALSLFLLFLSLSLSLSPFTSSLTSHVSAPAVSIFCDALSLYPPRESNSGTAPPINSSTPFLSFNTPVFSSGNISFDPFMAKVVHYPSFDATCTVDDRAGIVTYTLIYTHIHSLTHSRLIL